MLYATQFYELDGTTSEFEFSFAGVRPDAASGTTPYLDPSHVLCTLITPGDGFTPDSEEPIARVLVAPNRVQINPVGTAGKRLKVYRDSTIEYPLVDFAALTTPQEFDFDQNTRQMLFLAQESSDLATLAQLVVQGVGDYVQEAVESGEFVGVPLATFEAAIAALALADAETLASANAYTDDALSIGTWELLAEAALPDGAEPGDVFEVTVGGTYQGVTFGVGDLAVVRSNGTSVTRLPAESISASEAAAAVAAGVAGHEGEADPHPQYTNVFQYANFAAFPATGASGAIYIAEDKNKLYRWDGAAYATVAVGGPELDNNTVLGNVSGASALPYALTQSEVRELARPSLWLAGTGSATVRAHTDGSVTIGKHPSTPVTDVVGNNNVSIAGAAAYTAARPSNETLVAASIATLRQSNEVAVLASRGNLFVTLGPSVADSTLNQSAMIACNNGSLGATGTGSLTMRGLVTMASNNAGLARADYSVVIASANGGSINGNYTGVALVGGSSHTGSASGAAVLGGVQCTASGSYSTVVGSSMSTASGNYGAVLGSQSTTVGSGSAISCVSVTGHSSHSWGCNSYNAGPNSSQIPTFSLGVLGQTRTGLGSCTLILPSNAPTSGGGRLSDGSIDRLMRAGNSTAVGFTRHVKVPGALKTASTATVKFLAPGTTSSTIAQMHNDVVGHGGGTATLVVVTATIVGMRSDNSAALYRQIRGIFRGTVSTQLTQVGATTVVTDETEAGLSGTTQAFVRENSSPNFGISVEITPPSADAITWLLEMDCKQLTH